MRRDTCGSMWGLASDELEGACKPPAPEQHRVQHAEEDACVVQGRARSQGRVHVCKQVAEPATGVGQGEHQHQCQRRPSQTCHSPCHHWAQHAGGRMGVWCPGDSDASQEWCGGGAGKAGHGVDVSWVGHT